MPKAKESGMKVCGTCSMEKSVTEFNKSQSATDGLQWSCRECQRNHSVVRKEIRAAYNKKFREEHPDIANGWSRTYRGRHPEKRRESARLSAQRARDERPEETSGYARQWLLLRQYGMTMDDYDKMFSEQNGVCAVCGRKQTHSPAHNGYLCVDHDHITGKIRGLLCRKCNMALGHVDDSVHILRNMMEYIISRRYEWRTLMPLCCGEGEGI